MSMKSKHFFKKLKSIIRKVEAKVQNNYKSQFSDPEKHYCVLDNVNFIFDSSWEESDDFILEMQWRYGTEITKDNGEKDFVQNNINIYISINSLLNAKDVVTYFVGYVQGCIDSKENIII